MDVKLFGLSEAVPGAIGLEIKSMSDLRNNPLLLIQPSGNTFIYRALSWLIRTPLRDSEEWVPDSKRCLNEHKSGQRCLRPFDHEGKCKTMVMAEF